MSLKYFEYKTETEGTDEVYSCMCFINMISVISIMVFLDVLIIGAHRVLLEWWLVYISVIVRAT